MVELGGEELELDFRKSVEENAEDFYESSKKAKSIQRPVSLLRATPLSSFQGLL